MSASDGRARVLPRPLLPRGQHRRRHRRQHGPRAGVHGRARESRRRRLRPQPRRRRRHDARSWSRQTGAGTRSWRPTSRSPACRAGRRRLRARSSARSTSSSTAPASARSARCSSSAARSGTPTVAVNLTAAFEMSHEAAKRMIPQTARQDRQHLLGLHLPRRPPLARLRRRRSTGSRDSRRPTATSSPSTTSR